MSRRTGCAMSTIFAAATVVWFWGAPALAQAIENGAGAPGSPPGTQSPTPETIERASPTIATAPQADPPPAAAPAAPSAASPPQSAEPTTPSTPTPAASAQPPGPEASPPAAGAPAASATPAAAEAPPSAPPGDPVLAEGRPQLAEPAKGNVDRGDRAQLTTFYGERNEPPVWVSADGFTAKANHLLAEIRRADDWGLQASAFELPRPPAGAMAADVLAAAEIKLSLAALKYARHARGGRLDPALISKNIDVKLSFRDPKAVLQSLAASDAPGNVLRDLNPKHEQFQKLRQALLKAGGGHAIAEQT